MTISNQTILRNDYIANGTNTIFAFNFPIFYEPSEAIKFSIQVIIRNELGVETIKTENIDYTITYDALNIDNNVINQGNVVFTTAPANLYRVSLLRKLNLTQNTNLTNKGTDKFSGANVEASLDKLTLINLENKEIFNRCVLLPKSTNLSSIELPINLENANKVITVNSAGDNLTTKNLADINLATLTNFAKTLMDDNNANEARATLDAQQLNANLTALSNLISVSNLTALAGLTGASNKLPYFTGAGTMAVQDLIATATNAGIQTLVPIGSIIIWPVPTIPANYLICDGAAISRTTYADLFNTIGTYYGAGNGSTTFNLPNYRGLFLRGNDNGAGTDPSRSLGSYQEMSIQSHSHFISVSNETIAGGGSTIPCNRPGGIQINTNSVGGTETRPKNASVHFIIKHS